MENKSENQSTSTQSELDFDANQMEPITPRKSGTTDSSSFLNKFFGKKNIVQTNPFAERKEPTFGNTTRVTETSTTTAINQTVNYSAESVFKQPAQAVAKQIKPTENTEENKDKNEESLETTVVTESTSNTVENEVEQETILTEAPIVATKQNMKNPENWGFMQKLPQKHRRFIIAIAGAVAILIALLLLKPSSETADEYQVNNNNNTPIEFQSLTPNQPNEITDMANTTQPAEPPVVTQTQPESMSSAVNEAPINETATNAPVMPTTQPTPATQLTAATQSASEPVPMPEQPKADTQAQQAEKARQEQLQAEKAQQEQLAREQQLKARAEKAKAEQLAKAKAEKAKAEQLAKVKAAEKAKTEKLASEKARAQAALNGAPISEAKPATKKASQTTGSTTKTLTVPASTSLFQVFRTNGLDIRDVNAMTKAKGVDNALSRFKAGDKVQVSTNGEGRVTTMRLSDGSTFTRQADGSYKYSK